MLYRLASLAAAAVFLLAGSVALAVEDNGLGGTTLLAAGLVTLGAWICSESIRLWEERKPKPPDDGGRP